MSRWRGASRRRLIWLAAAAYVLTGAVVAQAQRGCVPPAAGCVPAAPATAPDVVVPKLSPHLQIEIDAGALAGKPPAPGAAPKPRSLPDGIKIEVLTIPEDTPDKPRKTTAEPIEVAPKPDRKRPAPRQARNSWDGLPEVAAPRLTADDLLDIPGQYIVDFNLAAFAAAGLNLQSISLADLAARLAVQPAQIRSIQRRFMHSAVLRVSPQQAAALAANPLVSAVHADTKIKASGGAPPLSWGLDRLDSPQRPLDGSFDRQSGVYAARVYLFDSEVADVSKELEARVLLRTRFTAMPDPQTKTCEGHGSEMASLIGGRTTGAAPRAEIMSLVVLPCDGTVFGEGASLVEAAEWLLVREAELNDSRPVIANMSLRSKWSRKLNSVVDVLSENGVVVVAAAGNDTQDACRFSPASAKDAITVGATGPNDEIYEHSNFGDCVKVHAPGVRITALKGGTRGVYEAVNGTSGAAALVSGVLARSLERKGVAEARDLLQKAALPARFWSKKDANALLTQLTPGWRSYCRTARPTHGRSLPLHESPGGKVIGSLAPDTLAQPERKSRSWIFVRLARGGSGWIGGDKENWPLLRSDSDETCPPLP